MSERVITKIRALLSKTEGAGCTAEEAESAFALAQRLMTKHAIEEADLVSAGHAPSEEIIDHRIPLRERDEIRRPKLALFSAIARANNCQVVDATQTHDQVWIVGHESEALFTEILAASVLMQYAVERTRGWKAYQESGGSASRFRWVVSFAWGYAERISERLAGAVDEAIDEAGEDEGASKELVFVGRKALVQDWMDSNLATVEKKSRPVMVLTGASEAGASAADRADLSGGRNNVRGGAAGELQ